MRILSALLLLSSLAACGQVGDLYLPAEKTDSVPASAPVAEEPKPKKK